MFLVEEEHGQDQRPARLILRIEFGRIWIGAAIWVWYVSQVSFLSKPIPQQYMVSLNTLSEDGKGEAYRKRDVHLALSLRILSSSYSSSLRLDSSSFFFHARVTSRIPDHLPLSHRHEHKCQAPRLPFRARVVQDPRGSKPWMHEVWS